jgi:two-component system, OmpR family, phosphate regulon response regulator PhoB
MPVYEQIDDSAEPDAKSALAYPGGHSTRPRVLLVEDDKALRRYLEFTLVQAGYEVILAADGLEGMKMALSSTIDIVVTDAMMPHLSGHEFCRFLRNSPHLSHIPIVMLSGSEPEQTGLNKDLADVFLSKPMSAELLTSCLEELLRRS